MLIWQDGKLVKSQETPDNLHAKYLAQTYGTEIINKLRHRTRVNPGSDDTAFMPIRDSAQLETQRILSEAWERMEADRLRAKLAKDEVNVNGYQPELLASLDLDELKALEELGL